MVVTDAELTVMAEENCECRPLDFARDSHSHDCNVKIFALIAEVHARRARDATMPSPPLLGPYNLASFAAAYANADGPIVTLAATAIQHAPHCHATIPTPDRPTGGCICGAVTAPT